MVKSLTEGHVGIVGTVNTEGLGRRLIRLVRCVQSHCHNGSWSSGGRGKGIRVNDRERIERLNTCRGRGGAGGRRGKCVRHGSIRWEGREGSGRWV